MVSIIFPNLNTPLQYLSPRISSIINQTFTDWECIVIDGFSDNGSMEMIQRETAGDNRFSYFQKPPKGIYDAWNEGIKLAKGEYVYIATSDDIFDPSFLQKMTGALDVNPDCGLAHCCLNIIDDNGNPTSYQWHDWEKVKFYGNMMSKRHKRIAPYDAIIHFGWNTVYTSIVQLLIRRSVFEKIGYFSTAYGSIADFEWELRASLTTNTLHIPLYLASWRKHAGQSTDDAYFNSPGFFSQLMIMSDDAFKKRRINKKSPLKSPRSLYFNYLFQQFNTTPRSRKLGFLLNSIANRPRLTIKLIYYRLFKIKFDAALFLRKELTKRNLNRLIE